MFLGPFVQPLSLSVQPAIPFFICYWQHLQLVGQSSSVPIFGMNLCSAISSENSRHTNPLTKEDFPLPSRSEPSAHDNLWFSNRLGERSAPRPSPVGPFLLEAAQVCWIKDHFRYHPGCAKAPNLPAYLQTHLSNMGAVHNAVCPPPTLPKRMNSTPMCWAFIANLVATTTPTIWGKDSIWGFISPFNLEKRFGTGNGWCSAQPWSQSCAFLFYRRFSPSKSPLVAAAWAHQHCMLKIASSLGCSLHNVFYSVHLWVFGGFTIPGSPLLMLKTCAHPFQETLCFSHSNS